MADPYGYAADAPATTDPARVLWMGIAAASLASIGVCACYMPYFVALPMGAWAVWKGSQMKRAGGDPKEQIMLDAGMVSGGISAAVSSMFVLFWLAYLGFIALYFVVIMVVVAAEAS